MSRIQQLLDELCPAGVEFGELREVAAYSKTRVDASELDETTFVGVDNLLPNKQGRVDAYYSPNSARLTAYRAGDILLGNIRPYLRKVWLADSSGGCSGDVLAVRIAQSYSSHLIPAYLYYLLSSESFFAYNMQHAKGAKMPRGNKDAIMRFPIPVPPVEVQREIVRILDTFSALETELEAELEARRRQYEHYRDAIMAFGDGVRRSRMADLGFIFGGLTGKAKADFSNGNARFVSYVNVLNHIAVDLDAQDFVRIEPGERQRTLRRGDILFTGSSETPDDVGLSSVVTAELAQPIYLNSFTIGFRPSDADLIDPEFAKHLFRSEPMRKQIVRTANGVTRFNVSKARLAQVEVPLPTLPEQRRIANLLDKLDALVSDLSVGLPAELAARRRQYEYYRDRLLTFEEAPS